MDRVAAKPLRPEILSALPTLQRMPDTQLQQAFELALSYLLLEEESQFDVQHASSVLQAFVDDVAVVITGLVYLVRDTVRMRSKLKEMQDQLTAQKLPGNITELVCKIVTKRRKELEAALLSKKPRLPSLDEFKWRVDVNISSNTVSRVMKPSLLTTLKTSDGKQTSMEIPLKQFHLLRYSVATLLKEMQDWESSTTSQMLRPDAV